jgi:branched-chain amino acid transport system substrate-binding protein
MRTAMGRAAALMAAAVLVVGCGSGSDDGGAAEDGPISVGVIMPLSGPLADRGKSVVEAVETMATLINERGGVMGRDVRILAKDDKSEPAVGVARANELIGDGVSAILEGLNSPVTLAMQPVIERAGITDVTVGSQAEDILSGKAVQNALRLNPSTSSGNEATAAIVRDEVGGRRIAYLVQNDVYGDETRAGIERALAESAAETVAVAEFPLEQTDFRVPLSKVKSARPDTVVAINAATSSGLPALIEQYAQAGIDATLVPGAGLVSPDVPELAGGKSAEGLISADIYFPDAEPFSTDPAAKSFTDAFRKRTGRAPEKADALAAAALQSWAVGVERAKSLEREAVVAKIRGHAIPDTPFGEITFDARGQAELRFYPYEIIDGKLVPRS